MKRFVMFFAFVLLCTYLIGSCKSADSDTNIYIAPSGKNEKEITSFSVSVEGGNYSASFNGYNATISIPYGADVTSLVPTITVSDGSSISPVSGVSQDFTNPQTYTVTAEDDSTQDYSIKVVGSKDLRAVVNGANRQKEVQNNDGTFEWDNPDTDKTDGPGATNTYGVTGIGFLGANEVTKDASYLDFAKITGDGLMTKFFGTNSISADNVNDSLRGNAFDIVFLYKLGKLSGVEKYTLAAKALLENTMYQTNYWSSCGNDGCTAQELYDAVDNFRSGSQGIEFWDLHTYVEAAELCGYAFARELKLVMESEYASNLNPSDKYYVLALAGIVDATGNSNAVTALLGLVQGNHWTSLNPEGDVQDTSYALKALVKLNDSANDDVINAGIEWLRNKQDGVTGGWKNDSDVENTELTSEALWALGYYIKS